MQAIILAGGFGTRLQSVVKDVPKPMADVLGRPFLTYLMDELSLAGFTKVVMAVGYKKEIIMDYFKSEYKNIKIEYSIESVPLGTGGCVRKALEYIDDDFAFILNGDTLFKVNFDEISRKQALTIACKKMYNFDRYGEVTIENGVIKAFKEKQPVEEGYINGGIYYIPINLFDNFSLGECFSIEKDFFEKYIEKLSIKAYLSDGYFIDIGIPSDYEKIQLDISGKNKAVFLDRDGVINIDYGHVHSIKDFKFNDYIFDLCKKYQELGYLLVVVTNQAGIGKALYTVDDYFKLTDYMLSVFKSYNINIAKVYYCPHKPEDNCSCRKPKSGLFLRAIEELNILPSCSIAIGDKMSDLIAAHNAGINKLFFVKTKYDEEPVPFSYDYLDLK